MPGIHQNYLTPEQHIPEKGLPYPWETCMTMAGSWSYVPNDSNLKWVKTKAGIEIELPSDLQNKGSFVWTLKVMD